jgi:hypothetical protein
MITGRKPEGKFFLPALLVHFVTEEVDARILAVFRIVYSLVGLVLVWQMLLEADFLWLRSDSRYSTATGLLSIIAFLLVAFCFGVGGRLVRIGHFAGISYLVSLLPISCIDYSLYLIGALWCCFLDLNVAWSLDRWFARRFTSYPGFFRPPGRSLAWPVFLLGCNLGLLIFSAGMLKHLDPQWHAGYGLYFTFLLPWIKAQRLTPVLNYHQVLRVLNYSVVVVEYSVLPLFLWYRTRLIAVVLAMFFFMGLIFPFRVDPIGYIGVAECICLSALAWNLPLRRPAASSPSPVTAGQMFSILAVVITLVFLGFVFTEQHVLEFRDRLTDVGGDHLYVRWPLKIVRTAHSSPLTAGSFLNDEQAANAEGIAEIPVRPVLEQRASLLHRAALVVLNQTSAINRHSTRLQVNHVFGIGDSRGNYLYRVVLILDDGLTREPFRVFQEDMGPGPYSSGILVPRFIQGSMYDVTAAVDEITYNHRVPDAEARSLMERAIQFSRSMLTEPDRNRVVGAQVLVRPILMPEVYEGNVAPWSLSSWTVLYDVGNVPDSGRFHMDLETYPLSYALNGDWRVIIAP